MRANRHGLPELCALAPHDRARQHRLRAQAAPAARPRTSRPVLRTGLRQGQPLGLENRYPGQLSGGQQQRVALGGRSSSIPTSCCSTNRSPISTPRFASRCARRSAGSSRELRITTVYVTHDQEEALSLSDRVAVMCDGRVLQMGSPRELYERPTSPFVADFVGTNNFLARGGARAGGASGSPCRPGLGWCAAARPAASTRAIGACWPCAPRTSASTRPAATPRPAVPASRPGPGQGQQLAGRVVVASYLGSTLRYDVEVAGDTSSRSTWAIPGTTSCCPPGAR